MSKSDRRILPDPRLVKRIDVATREEQPSSQQAAPLTGEGLFQHLQQRFAVDLKELRERNHQQLVRLAKA